MESKKIKWFLFDVTGVIVNLSLLNPEGYSIGSRFFNQVDLYGVFLTKEYQSYMLGTLSHEQCFGRYLRKRKLDLSVEELDEIIKKDIVPTDGMETLVSKLEKKYKIALATNEGKLIAKYKIEGSRLLPHLSKVVASYLLREVKPSHAFYKKLLEIIGAQPEECVFIDDKEANVNAAIALGMRGFVFKNTPLLEKELDTLQLL